MKYLRGTSIIEIVIATALISVAIIAALSLTNSSQKQNIYARNLAEATKYTTQLVDWVRTQRDTVGWSTIAAQNNGSYCLTSLPVDWNALPSPGSCGPGSYIQGTTYQREITLESTDADKASGLVKIIVSTTWLEQVPRQATVEMELTQWN